VEWVTTTTILQKLCDFENRDAWERLVDRFRRPIMSFVREVGVASADCEDVAQGTLLAFAEGIRAGKYDRTRGRLSRWLFGLAYYQALRRRRKDAHDPPAPNGERSDGAGAEPESAVAHVWDRVWERFILDKGIEQARREFAPEIFRAFELVVLEDLPPAEAARSLGTSVKSVYNAKHRVLKRVRELIAEVEDLGEDESEVPGP
jgi:RNA polymerase sigma-70 factor (ECF subfamily)